VGSFFTACDDETPERLRREAAPVG
jgi:hypothetical protein